MEEVEEIPVSATEDKERGLASESIPHRCRCRLMICFTMIPSTKLLMTILAPEKAF